MDAVEHSGEKAEKQPVRDLFRHHLRPTLIAFGTCVLKAVGFYAVFTFMPVCLRCPGMRRRAGNAHHEHPAGCLYPAHLRERVHLR